jgi:hypothetical protein
MGSGSPLGTVNEYSGESLKKQNKTITTIVVIMTKPAYLLM